MVSGVEEFLSLRRKSLPAMPPSHFMPSGLPGHPPYRRTCLSVASLLVFPWRAKPDHSLFLCSPDVSKTRRNLLNFLIAMGTCRRRWSRKRKNERKEGRRG
ncbi:hypothetical protein E2C01_032958 [Portunus trituberculatus]|uniref:Uncharacterized protein n=1 Tax=Portunus trituberculatus TaxID=210409 RepID=A0A5B7EYV2_PORTR|nr:hypothetical protein [Portunus trituberculatus]